MAEVFISYSTADTAFARRLYESLKQAKRPAWIDWKDIPPTAAWWNEITSAIESADSFVFVISPDSIASETCWKEITHAAQNNKKLIPLLFRPVNLKTLIPPLSDIQWISFCAPYDFQTAFQLLIQAVDTDLEWWRAHRRLLVQALEWERTGHNPSFLLRGNPLRTTEQWMADVGPAGEPRPTVLQSQYILASQRAEVARRRKAFALVSLGLIFTSLLALFAWREKSLATKQQQIAVARQLAAQSESLRSQYGHLIETSVLLAVESLRQSPSLEGNQAIRLATRLLPRPLLHLTFADKVDSVDLSPDGEFLSITNGDILQILSVANRQYICTIKIPGHTRVHFGAKSRLFFKINREGLDTHSSLEVWNANTCQLITEIKTGELSYFDIAVSQDSRYVAATDNSHRIKIWDIQTGNPIAILKSKYAGGSVSFSPDNKYLASLGDGLTIWDVFTGRLLARHDVADGYHSVAVGFRGNDRLVSVQASVASGGVFDNFTVQQWPWGPGGLGPVFSKQYYPGRTLRLSPNADFIAIMSLDGAHRIFRLEGNEKAEGEIGRFSKNNTFGEFSFDKRENRLAAWGYHDVWVYGIGEGQHTSLLQFLNRDNVKQVVFDPYKRYVATIEDAPEDRPSISDVHDQILSIWDVKGEREILQQHVLPVWDIAFSPNGRLLVIRCDDSHHGIVLLWDVFANHELVRKEYSAADNDKGLLRFSEDGKYLAVSVPTGDLALWDVESGRLLSEIKPANIITMLGFRNHGSTLVTVDVNSSITSWDVRTGRNLGSLDQDVESQGAIPSPANKYVAIAQRKGVKLFDAKTGRELVDIAVGGYVAHMAFSPDEKLLVTAIPRGPATVWRVSDGSEVARLSYVSRMDIYDEGVTGFAFSLDGRFLAAADASYIHLWEMATFQEVDRMERSYGALSFSPEGRYLIAPGHAWLIQTNDLITEACARLTRNLTLQEWHQYFPSEPYRKTCPEL